MFWLHSLFQVVYVRRVTEVLTPSGPSYGSHQRAIASGHGRLWVAYVRAEVVEESRQFPHRITWTGGKEPIDEPTSRYDAPAWLAWLGIDWKWKDRSRASSDGQYVYRELFFSIPYWLLIVLTGAAGWRLGRTDRIERRRLREGRCPACGYDLRATPGRCPECGKGD